MKTHLALFALLLAQALSAANLLLNRDGTPRCQIGPATVAHLDLEDGRLADFVEEGEAPQECNTSDVLYAHLVLAPEEPRIAAISLNKSGLLDVAFMLGNVAMACQTGVQKPDFPFASLLGPSSTNQYLSGLLTSLGIGALVVLHRSVLKAGIGAARMIISRESYAAHLFASAGFFSLCYLPPPAPLPRRGPSPESVQTRYYGEF